MNKRFVAATTMMAMFVTSAAAATAYQKSITANYGISLEINGNKANLTDVNGKTVEPFTYNGTTYVPIRAVAENMGSYVGYDASTKTAIVYQDDTEAIVFAHKIAEASQHMHSIIDALYSTCTARRDNIISVYQANTDIQNLVNSGDTTMSEIESTYKILQDNSNIYLSDINNCMSRTASSCNCSYQCSVLCKLSFLVVVDSYAKRYDFPRIEKRCSVLCRRLYRLYVDI